MFFSFLNTNTKVIKFLNESVILKAYLQLQNFAPKLKYVVSIKVSQITFLFQSKIRQ